MSYFKSNTEFLNYNQIKEGLIETFNQVKKYCKEQECNFQIKMKKEFTSIWISNKEFCQMLLGNNPDGSKRVKLVKKSFFIPSMMDWNNIKKDKDIIEVASENSWGLMAEDEIKNPYKEVEKESIIPFILIPLSEKQKKLREYYQLSISLKLVPQ